MFCLACPVVEIGFDAEEYTVEESSGFVVLSLVRETGTAVVSVSITVVPTDVNSTAQGEHVTHKP